VSIVCFLCVWCVFCVIVGLSVFVCFMLCVFVMFNACYLVSITCLGLVSFMGVQYLMCSCMSCVSWLSLLRVLCFLCVLCITNDLWTICVSCFSLFFRWNTNTFIINMDWWEDMYPFWSSHCLWIVSSLRMCVKGMKSRTWQWKETCT
jgi:hypothetical protein